MLQDSYSKIYIYLQFKLFSPAYRIFKPTDCVSKKHLKLSRFNINLVSCSINWQINLFSNFIQTFLLSLPQK